MKKLFYVAAIMLSFLSWPTVSHAGESFTVYADTTELSADDAMVYYCSSCTADSYGKMRNWTPSIGGLPDVDTTGVATGDLLYYSGGSVFIPLDIGEVAGAAAVNAGGTGINITTGTVTFTGASSVGIGPDITSSGGNQVVIGRNASATVDDAISIGQNSSTSAADAVALGKNASVTGANGTVVGSFSNATKTGSVAIGYNNDATGDYAIAIGQAAQADQNRCVALGFGANCTADYQIMMGSSSFDVYIPGTLTFESAQGLVMVKTTVGALGTATDGAVKLVSDATSVTDCTTGGGSTYNMCVGNGTSWVDF